MAAITHSSPSSVLLNNPKLRLPASTDPPTETSLASRKVWLIFGATGHVGRSLVKAALGHGDDVTAVGRAVENRASQMQGWHERCQGLLCDVRVRETVDAVIQKCIKHWGRVDIIVNCTGYGVLGSCEDQDAGDLRSQFDTNFFGTLNIIQLSLPYFREQSAKRKDGENAGRYVIFSSMSGAVGVPGLGPYCATKCAVEGLIESMLYEVDAFGIKATLVEPGHMRMDDADELKKTDASAVAGDGDEMKPPHLFGHFLVKTASEPYDTPTSPAGHAYRMMQWLANRQPTSTVRSAELVWQLGHCRFPPLRLLLGSFAIESIRDRLRSIIEEIEDWKHLSFPATATENEKDKEGLHEDEGGNNAMDLDDEQDGRDEEDEDDV